MARKTVTKQRQARPQALSAPAAPQKMAYEQAQANIQGVFRSTYGEEALRVYNEMRAKEALLCMSLDAAHEGYPAQHEFFTHA